MLLGCIASKAIKEPVSRMQATSDHHEANMELISSMALQPLANLQSGNFLSPQRERGGCPHVEFLGMHHGMVLLCPHW